MLVSIGSSRETEGFTTLSNMTPIVEGKVQDCCYVAFSESQYLTKGNEGWRLGDYHTFQGS